MKKLLLLSLVAATCLLVIVGLVCAGDKQYRTLVIKEFSLENTAIQEKPEVQDFAKTLPVDFANNLKEYFEKTGAFDKVIVGESVKPEGDYAVMEGQFTKITAGNTAARMFAGFGAGASTVGAKWTVKDAKTGAVLASGERNKHTSSGATGIRAVESDARALAKDIATLTKKEMK